jgi:acyl carrier protein
MSATLEDLKKTFAFAIPADVLAKIDPAKPLTAQGVDSLAMTAMAVAVQNAFGLKISVEDGLKLKTLNDVLVFINKAR